MKLPVPHVGRFNISGNVIRDAIKYRDEKQLLVLKAIFNKVTPINIKHDTTNDVIEYTALSIDGDVFSESAVMYDGILIDKYQVLVTDSNDSITVKFVKQG